MSLPQSSRTRAHVARRGALAVGAALLVLAALPSLALAAKPRLSVSDVRVVEGDAGVVKAVFSIRRSGGLRRSSRVSYATVNGTAAAGSDYTSKRGRLRFRAGQRKRRVVVLVRGDQSEEADEAFFLRLSRPRRARLARARGRGTIADDDGVVRFIALGNTGQGNTAQSDVAAAMEAKCAASGCDYVLGLGSNIFDSGVSSVNDPQFQTKFETPYQNLSLPFWMQLGNHDYGMNGTGFDAARAQYQVDYTTHSTRWMMPAEYYRRTDGQVEFFTLDTTAQLFGLDTQQELDVAGWITGSSALWKIALGHHTYRSNGPHGNAGGYDGLLSSNPAAGQGVKDFIEDHVCGKADLYISAYDRSLQWPSQTCMGTELIVSGSGAGTTTLTGSNATHFESAALGFVYIAIQDRRLTAELVDVNGATLFTRTLTK
jgi:hypothetical protein